MPTPKRPGSGFHIRRRHKNITISGYYDFKLEASEGIEPPYKDLQSSASPLRHEASCAPAADRHAARYSKEHPPPATAPCRFGMYE